MRIQTEISPEKKKKPPGFAHQRFYSHERRFIKIFSYRNSTKPNGIYATFSVQHFFETALYYIDHGKAVFPVNQNKKPMVKWKPYQMTAPTLAEVKQWAGMEPYGLALVTGSKYGILVLDIDKGGHETLERLGNRRIPATFTVKTQNDNRHYYFKFPAELKKISTTKSHIYGKDSGVDVKGRGGFVLAPMEGTGYEVLDNRPMAKCPKWLIDDLLIKKKPRQADKTTPISRVLTLDKPTSPKTIKAAHNPFCDPEKVQAMMRHLGIEADIGQSFCCILPGHAESNPSAAIMDYRGEYYDYVDFHQKDGQKFYTLPEVFASQHYGKAVKLNKPEMAVWGIRLLVEAGIIELPVLESAPLPPGKHPDSLLRVWEGFRYLLAVKKAYSGHIEATAFTEKFAPIWCGVGIRGYKNSIKTLQELKYLTIAGKLHRQNLYITDKIHATGSVETQEQEAWLLEIELPVTV